MLIARGRWQTEDAKAVRDAQKRFTQKYLAGLKENKQLKAEVTQIKTLNEKLSEKAEYLQSIIDKEASANTYYFNYPPKAEGGEGKPGKPASDSEAAKVKKMYEE